MFEGVPTYPTASRCWEICDEHEINIFYTAPTAIRALMSLEMNLLEVPRENRLKFWVLSVNQ